MRPMRSCPAAHLWRYSFIRYGTPSTLLKAGYCQGFDAAEPLRFRVLDQAGRGTGSTHRLAPRSLQTALACRGRAGAVHCSATAPPEAGGGEQCTAAIRAAAPTHYTRMHATHKRA
jgi:hypothetical protein